MQIWDTSNLGRKDIPKDTDSIVEFHISILNLNTETIIAQSA
jgi:hypothetical protein